MGCRPAKFSGVTDSIVVTNSNGIKITSEKENSNQTNVDSNINEDKDPENDGKEKSKNERNLMITNYKKEESRAARRANRRIGPAREIGPIFRNVPSIVLERSKSQIDFFMKLEDRINKGETTDKNEVMELESL